jgi:hypothetical protein
MRDENHASISSDQLYLRASATERADRLARNAQHLVRDEASIDFNQGIACSRMVSDCTGRSALKTNPRPVSELPFRRLYQSVQWQFDSECVAENRREQLSLEPQLRRILNVLPIAPAASRQVSARRRATAFAGMVNTSYSSNRVPAPLIRYFELDNVARRSIGNHDGAATIMRDRIRSKGYRLDLDIRHRFSSLMPQL